MAALMQRYGGMQPGGPHPWNMGMGSGDAAMGGPAPSNIGMRMAMGGPRPGNMGMGYDTRFAASPPPVADPGLTGGGSSSPFGPAGTVIGGLPQGLGSQMDAGLRAQIPGLQGNPGGSPPQPAPPMTGGTSPAPGMGDQMSRQLWSMVPALQRNQAAPPAVPPPSAGMGNHMEGLLRLLIPGLMGGR